MLKNYFLVPTLNSVHKCFFCSVKDCYTEEEENYGKDSAIDYTVQIKCSGTGNTKLE
jgi:hypothetical protein